MLLVQMFDSSQFFFDKFTKVFRVFCVGKLHHHIVALQVSEGMAIKKLETAQSKVLLQL